MKKIVALLLTIVLIVSLAACGVQSESTQTKEQITSTEEVSPKDAAVSEKEVTLSFWITANLESSSELELPEEDRYLHQAISRFQASHPNVNIEVTNYGDSTTLLNNYKAAVLAGEGPDMIQIFSGPTLLPLMDSFVALNDYLDEDHLNNMVGWETCADNMDVNSTIFAIPCSGQSVVCLAYNKSLVSAAGLDFEANPPRTIEEFYSAMDAIKATGVTPFHCDESWPELVLYDLGLWWTQKTGIDGMLAHNLENVPYAEDEGFLFMLEEYQKFYQNGWINKDTATSADEASIFLQGGSALHPFGLWSLADYREALGDDLGIIPIPSAIEEDVDKLTAVGGCGACMAVPNFSENQDIAVEFLMFLSSKDEMVEFYKQRVAIPLRTDITAEEIGQGDDPLYAKCVQMADSIYYYPDNCISSDAAAVYYKMLCQVLVGNMTPMELALEMDNAQE